MDKNVEVGRKSREIWVLRCRIPSSHSLVYPLKKHFSRLQVRNKSQVQDMKMHQVESSSESCYCLVGRRDIKKIIIITIQWSYDLSALGAQNERQQFFLEKLGMASWRKGHWV